MKSFAVVAAVVGAASATAVTSAIAPAASAPAGCLATVSGSFMIETLASGSKTKRDASALMVSLAGGVLTDAQGRTGYIASNNQFQFDSPVQAGAIYTAGFSLCANNSIALGGSTVFYQCLSGSFYNLYDASEGAQCSQIFLNRYVGASASVASTASDGQVTAASAASVQSDGQVTAAAAATVICQISDGQVQKNTCLSPVTQIADGQVQASSARVVSQITDGQVQATSAATVTAAKTSATVVSQISDGQVQAASTNHTTVASATLTAATSAKAATSSVKTTFTGAAAVQTLRAELFGLAAGVLALAAL